MNISRRAAALVSLILLTGCTSPAEQAPPPPAPEPARAPTEAATLTDLVRAWVDARAELDPDWATRTGVHEHDARLTRYDDRSWQSRRQLARAALVAVERWPTADLSVAERGDAELFGTLLRVEVHEDERHDARRDSPGMALLPVAAVNDLLIRDFAPREERAWLAVSRLQQLPGVLAELRPLLDRPPALWTGMAIKEIDGALAFLDDVPALAGPTPGLDEALAAARAALADHRTFLEQEVLPRSDGSYAIGRAEFDWRLRNVYLLDLDAERLLAMGRQQFDLTLRLLDETAQQIDPARDWRALLAEMMEQHPTQEALLDTYRDEVAHARQFLIDHDIVGIPDETLAIRETPAFMRTTTPFAAYDMPAPLDESRLGNFFVTPDPEAHILSDIPGTTWHEAYPGHHLQFVYAKDNPSLVRRLNESPLLSEGWGFYCEELAHETGYYDDPRERLMQLNWRLQREARVMLDCSIHAFGMSYEDAVAFLTDQVGLSRGTAEASVNAYTRQPTYFSSYMLGMLEIVRMREACRERLGPGFSLREFHERLLRCGNVPPALVEQALAEWR